MKNHFLSPIQEMNEGKLTIVTDNDRGRRIKVDKNKVKGRFRQVSAFLSDLESDYEDIIYFPGMR